MSWVDWSRWVAKSTQELPLCWRYTLHWDIPPWWWRVTFELVRYHVYTHSIQFRDWDWWLMTCTVDGLWSKATVKMAKWWTMWTEWDWMRLCFRCGLCNRNYMIVWRGENSSSSILNSDWHSKLSLVVEKADGQDLHPGCLWTKKLKASSFISLLRLCRMNLWICICCDVLLGSIITHVFRLRSHPCVG